MKLTYTFNIITTYDKHIDFTDKEITDAFNSSRWTEKKSKDSRYYVDLNDVQQELFDRAEKLVDNDFKNTNTSVDYSEEDESYARKKLLKQWALAHGYRETKSDDCYCDEDILTSIWRWC